MIYAQQVKRMTRDERTTAAYEVEMFAHSVGYFIDREDWISKDKYSHTGTIYRFENDDIVNGDIYFSGVDIVRCPHCNDIQVCWGQFGDPEIEECICSECNKGYTTE